MDVTEAKSDFAPSRFVNALVEAGLASTTILLALFGLPWWPAAVMMMLAAVWWGFVHRHRVAGMVRASLPQTLGTVALALGLIVLVHGVGFGFGAALHALIG
ncbi:MAG: hypothetical protein O9270_14990 [Aquidulcibacter sp.]|jgi:hypothetical protein|uniref:hypothetical protein n=1 Tax=Aquidulcibacter sp. TaxID=2052990 RepID=UPI0022C18626|nr:hypothetical protein [Aquidulcibacter sp.]MCE2889820.1 hypothetical protein [Hyphomonadaceae bacterium]MCZ8209485.1 hypothetical protein [Aquidulcibacter sp.]